MNNVGVAWDYPEYFAEIDVEVREIFPMAHIWLILYLRNRKHFLCFHTVIETLVEVLPNFHECFYNVWQGRSQDFQRGGIDFLLKREKQGASEASVAYLCGFRGEAPEDIPFPWIWKPQITRKLTSGMLFSLWIIPIQWRLLWRPLWQLLRRHFCDD